MLAGLQADFEATGIVDARVVVRVLPADDVAELDGVPVVLDEHGDSWIRWGGAARGRHPTGPAPGDR